MKHLRSIKFYTKIHAKIFYTFFAKLPSSYLASSKSKTQKVLEKSTLNVFKSWHHVRLTYLYPFTVNYKQMKIKRRKQKPRGSRRSVWKFSMGNVFKYLPIATLKKGCTIVNKIYTRRCVGLLCVILDIINTSLSDALEQYRHADSLGIPCTGTENYMKL